MKANDDMVVELNERTGVSNRSFFYMSRLS